MHAPHVRSGGRYPVLRSLAILYLLGAAVAAVAGVVAAVWALARAPYGMADRAVLAAGSLAAAFFLVISMLAIAEVLKLFIDVEHNTRVAALGAQQRATVVTAGEAAVVVPGGSDGGATVRTPNRLDELDEETAEAALLRGH